MRHGWVFVTKCCAGFLMMLAGCNSRPTYNILVYDFTSDCEGAIATRFEHDPDPEVRSVSFEPDFAEPAAQAGLTLRDDGQSVLVGMKSGIACAFTMGGRQGKCHLQETKVQVPCTAQLQVHSYRYPSKGPGFDPPIAKPGEDKVPVRP